MTNPDWHCVLTLIMVMGLTNRRFVSVLMRPSPCQATTGGVARTQRPISGDIGMVRIPITKSKICLLLSGCVPSLYPLPYNQGMLRISINSPISWLLLSFLSNISFGNVRKKGKKGKKRFVGPPLALLRREGGKGLL